MNALRSWGAWLSAAVASVSMLVVLVVLQALSHVLLDDLNAPRSGDSSVLEWLGRTYVGFFGVGAFNPGHGKMFLGTLVAVVVLLVAGLLGSWLAVRGIPPGSAALPAFLSVWMVLVLATALAGFAALLVRQAGQPGTSPMGQFLVSALSTGVVFGVKWGWIAAALASLTRLASRTTGPAQAPPEEAPRPTSPGRPGVVPEGGFVLKRVSDFPEVAFDPPPSPVAQRPSATEAGTSPFPEEQPAEAPEEQPTEAEEPSPRYVGRRAAARAEDSPPENGGAPHPGRRARTTNDS